MRMFECQTEEDYERFAVFFLQNRNSFDDMYSILGSIGSLYAIIESSIILLVCNNEGDVIAAVSYTLNPPDNPNMALINCALLQKEYQSSLVFVQGFYQMTQHIAANYPQVTEVQFEVYRHHYYIHNLYQKFASIIAEKEGDFGIQDIFAVDFATLTNYLQRFFRKENRAKGEQV
ncbi:hypothetical protein [Lysinibacillus piscis]|uniref:GNAT family N-acetyltransferase n=1 Tax=Lysinibacillus piscis TaxID=2518931 RepID=A0ABQ5NN01_9BACI|nr:hypothetical protein [Lysinibacillus sp. KH24]GLC89493.1 hypothetical protein LYSBPC_26200 [Lysinibacillus sp. KH24]